MNDTIQRPDPSQLLEAFLASNRSEKAFTSLVKNMSGLVFSCALRRTANQGLAEEITQNVFAILARKAESLRRHPCLAAWILETTKIESANAVRAEQRRIRKISRFANEAEAQTSDNTHAMEPDAAWKYAIPVLDDALNRLPLKERKIVLQRFFEGKNFREIALESGQSEGAAKMRIKRTLEKLSTMLTARGVTLSVTGLATLLGSELASGAPVQTAAAIASKALVASSTISTAALAANTIQTMSTLKTTTTTAAVVLAIAAIPFAGQISEAKRLQNQLRLTGETQTSAESSLRTKNSIRDTTERKSGGLTAAGMLAAMDKPVDSRILISSLLMNRWDEVGMSAINEDMAYMRIARMSPEEIDQLLIDIRDYPCERFTRDLLVDKVMELTGKKITLREKLDQMVASGREISNGSAMRVWASREPEAALAWYREKLASGALDTGINDELQKSLVGKLMEGLAPASPRLAIDLYRQTAREDMDSDSIPWLASELSNGIVASGDDSYLKEFLDLHTDKEDRYEIMRRVLTRHGNAGDLKSGIAIVESYGSTDAEFRAKALFKLAQNVSSFSQINSWQGVDVGTGLNWAFGDPAVPAAPEEVRDQLSTVWRTFPTETTAWLESQQPGNLRDLSVAGIVDARLIGLIQGQEVEPDFKQALVEAESIGDVALRADVRQKVGETWFQKDKQGASEGLPADLLNQINAQ